MEGGKARVEQESKEGREQKEKGGRKRKRERERDSCPSVITSMYDITCPSTLLVLNCR